MALDFQHNAHANRSVLVAAVVACLLHILVAPHISLLGGQFNFMLAFVITSALGGDSRLMVYVGFAAGLYYDLTTLAPIGLMTLLLTIAGYLFSSMSRGVTPGFSMDALRLAALGVFGVLLLNSVLLFFMGIETNVLVAVGSHGFTSSVLTLIACVPFLLFKNGSTAGSGFRGGRGGLQGSRYKSLR